MAPNCVMLQLVKGMMERKYECHVFYFDHSGTDSIAFPCPTTRIRLWQYVDFSSYDVVHTHGLRPNLYVWLHLQPVSVRKVATIHSYIFEEFHSIYGRLLGAFFSHLFVRTLQRHDRIVTLSQDAEDYYARWISRSRLTYCYNGVELPTKMPAIAETDRRSIMAHKGDGILVANICYFDKIKGLDILIRALALLPPHYRLLLIGGGAEEHALKRLARQLCPGRVLFLGSRWKASRYLSLIDVFAQTSWSEGFCLSMAEAALARVPIVSSDIAGMREKYDAETVTFFPAGDTQALAEAIQNAAASNSKVSKAFQTVNSRFTVAQMIKRYESIYKD